MFYASKLQDYVEEGLLFQNVSKSKNYPCWPWSPISSHNTKLGHATFCWFCDAGSHFTLLHSYPVPLSLLSIHCLSWKSAYEPFHTRANSKKSFAKWWLEVLRVHTNEKDFAESVICFRLPSQSSKRRACECTTLVLASLSSAGFITREVGRSITSL